MRKKQEENDKKIENSEIKKANKKETQNNSIQQDNNKKEVNNSQKTKSNKKVKSQEQKQDNSKVETKNNKLNKEKKVNSIKNEELEEKIESTEKDTSKKEIAINEEQLDKIKDEIKNSKEEKKANPKKQKIKKDIFRNILIAVIVTVYFVFIALGVTTIPVTEYALDLKTFAIFTAIIAIIIFERAYKKDANYLALHGIEMIVVGIETLVILQLYLVESAYFKNVLIGIAIGMILYYIIKSIIIWIRSKSSKSQIK